VAKAGATFGIVKATEGSGYLNPYFAVDYAAARRVGLTRGSYHFAHPGYPILSSAVGQAQFYAEHLGSVATTKTLPPALDLEVTGGLSGGALVTWAQDFLMTLHRLTGRVPMVYSYPWFWTNSLDDPSALARYPLWMASYASTVSPTPALWQYTASAKLSGIRGPVDMSRFVGPSTGWASLSNGTTAAGWAVGIPAAPVAVSATAGVRAATVRWLPGDTSSPINGYTVVADPGGATLHVAGTDTMASFANLSTTTAYRFTVRASNASGSGTWSQPSAPVTPKLPPPPSAAPAVTVHLNRSAVPTGQVVLMYGRVTPSVSGQVVWREGYYAGAWHIWARARTSPHGWYSFWVRPTVRTVDVYRVVAVSTGARPAGVSEVIRLRVF
jgi:lysozyme